MIVYEVGYPGCLSNVFRYLGALLTSQKGIVLCIAGKGSEVKLSFTQWPPATVVPELTAAFEIVNWTVLDLPASWSFF